MLLTNRRVALIYLCLAGMEATWLLPLWLLAYRGAPGAWASFALLLGGLLAWLLALELLSRTGIKSPLYDLVALAAMFVMGLLLVRVVLYPDWPGLGLGWIARAAVETATYRLGLLPPALVLIGFNLLLWQRATVATGRDISFFSVGVAFRAGLLLFIAGGAICTAVRGLDLLPFLWIYFALGLTAVALARVTEKAAEAQSVGVTLPARRLVQVLAAIGGTVGLVALLAQSYTPVGVRGFLSLFEPLWRYLRPLLLGLLLLLARLLDPVLLWLERVLIRLLSAWGGLPEIAAPPPPTTGDLPAPLERTISWLGPLLVDIFLSIGIVLVVVTALAVLLLYLERVGRVSLRSEPEEEGAEAITLGGGIVRRGLAQLRRAVRLVGRFGLGGRLLAAVSVQNIYANLCRLAGQRGHPRPPAQPPDDYLPTLRRVFPGHDEALARITAAYMRVHYGDHPVTLAELAALRQDYRAVRESEAKGVTGN